MIDYINLLNQAQYDAVTAPEKAVLVIAGAGSGKTRTIVYRLAWQVEQGILPDSILLLTFTRKAAQEMLKRAGLLLDQNLGGIAGGTFHAFAFSVLRHYQPQWLGERKFTLMDPADVIQVLRDCRENLKISKKDHAFPKYQTISGIFSKVRNKELPLNEILRRESSHLVNYGDDLQRLFDAFTDYKRRNALLDYDDLLFELEETLKNNKYVSSLLQNRFSSILVDEYQDTNLVQARIVRLLSGAATGKQVASVMAVGDEAQSIYAFRGANVGNILQFPQQFPGARLIRLEENYRSTQPVLEVANNILDHAAQSFDKKLFTRKEGGTPARIINTVNDISEAELVCNRVEELLAQYKPSEIAVLFRSGFHSYPLEAALRKAGIAFNKFGGLRFTEAAHIKDVIAYARLVINPMDLPAFSRIALQCKGVGPKTAVKLFAFVNHDEKFAKATERYPELAKDMAKIKELREKDLKPGPFFEELIDYYRPRLERLYPDDWPTRLKGLEELPSMARNYDLLDLFVADLALETPEEDDKNNNAITLSTIHSAKGLEWEAVLIIELVEDRFPSRHSLANSDEFEEERRLFYVACTRSKDILELYSPLNVYNYGGYSDSARESPFLCELSDPSILRFKENLDGELVQKNKKKASKKLDKNHEVIQIGGRKARLLKPQKLIDPNFRGYCHHKIFGRGKILKKIDDDSVQVNFEKFGAKIIRTEYLEIEQ